MPGQGGDEPLVTGRDGPARGHGDHPRLPPGQYVQARMPVLHYGPVPACNQQTWDLRVYGAPEAGRDRRRTRAGFRALPRTEIIADFPFVTEFSVLGITWPGVADAAPLVPRPPSR